MLWLMNIPKILLSAAAAVAISLPFAVSAQQTPTIHHAHHVNYFRSGLNSVGLSATQHQQIRSLYQNFRSQHPKGTKPGKAAMKQLREQIIAVLTPQQKQQLHAYIRSHRGANRTPGAAGSPLPNPFTSSNPQ